MFVVVVEPRDRCPSAWDGRTRPRTLGDLRCPCDDGRAMGRRPPGNVEFFMSSFSCHTVFIFVLFLKTCLISPCVFF